MTHWFWLTRVFVYLFVDNKCVFYDTLIISNWLLLFLSIIHPAYWSSTPDLWFNIGCLKIFCLQPWLAFSKGWRDHVFRSCSCDSWFHKRANEAFSAPTSAVVVVSSSCLLSANSYSRFVHEIKQNTLVNIS